MSRQQAIRILADHGEDPTYSMASLNGQTIEVPGFNATFGIRKTYSAKAVYQWLGY